MKKILLLGLLLVIVAAFFHFELEQYLTLEYVKTQQQIIDQYYAENSALTLIGFFLLYIVITGVSLPGATVLTLAGGAIFGVAQRTHPGVFRQHHRRFSGIPGFTLPVPRHGAVSFWKLVEGD